MYTAVQKTEKHNKLVLLLLLKLWKFNLALSTCVLEREAYVRDNELSTFCPIFRRRDFRYTLSLVLIITR